MPKLGSLAVGSIVKLNVSGVATDFLVVQQGLPSSLYDSSCDGTWLLMKDIYETREYYPGNNNSYATSTIHEYLNNTFVNLFDSDICDLIKQVKVPYTNGKGNAGSLATGADGISAKVFLLSCTEVGFTGTSWNIEGAVLSYFNGGGNSKRIAYLNGSAKIWLLRSPQNTSSTSTYKVSATGSYTGSNASTSGGVRPALVLPVEMGVDAGGFVTLPQGINGAVNIGGAWKELSASHVNVGGVWKDVSEGYENIGGVWKPIS